MKISNLFNKTFIVTGGSLGIGLTIAKKIANCGGRVIIAARNKPDLINAVEALNTISSLNHLYYQVDLGDLNEVENFAKWFDINIHKINGLINCAGIYGPIGKTTELDLKFFHDTIKINFLGTVYMCSLFSKYFHNDARKKIINLSGGGAATPFPNYSSYATSKAAVVRFTENLSLELANDNFDINCVAPGFVLTRLHNQTLDTDLKDVGQAFYDNTKKQVKTGGTSPEIAADLIAFLLSDESNGITGKFISAPWDPWKDDDFINLLKTDADFCTLRRIDNKTFYKKLI